MKVLITGGAGFIGFKLAKFHASIGDRVIIFDSLFKSNQQKDRELEELLHLPNVVFYQLDLTKPISLELKEEIDIIYHLAAINGTKLFYEMPYELCLSNLLITINFLKFLETIKFSKIVFSSTSEVYAGAFENGLMTIPTAEDVPIIFSQPTHTRFSYASSKFVSEYLCLQFGKKFEKDISVIRYHNIYGPRMGFKHVVPEIIMRMLNNESPFNVYGATETRAFCYVDDAVNATFKVASSSQTNQEIIHIGDQNGEVNILELAKRIKGILKKDVNLIPLEGLPGSVQRRCPDTSKLRALTDFKISTNLDEGLKKSVDWYKEYFESTK